jgi:uncharacterized membrane protein
LLLRAKDKVATCNCAPTKRMIKKIEIIFDKFFYNSKRNFFAVINTIIFLLIIVWEDSLRGFFEVNIYYYKIMLIWMIFVSSVYSYRCWENRTRNKSIDTIFSVAPILLGILLSGLSLLIVVTKTIDFQIALLAILFMFFPCFYIVLSLLDLFDNILVRIFLACAYSAILSGYTFLIFGIYNLGTLVAHKKDFIEVIQSGALSMSLTNLKLETLAQYLIVLFGGYTISYMFSVVSKGRTFSASTTPKEVRGYLPSLVVTKKFKGKRHCKKN